MKRHHLIILLILCCLTACSGVDSTQVFDGQQAANLLHEQHATRPSQQLIKLALPNKQHWKKIDMSYGTVGTPIMLIPSHESRSEWSESIRTKIRAFVQDSDATAVKVAQAEIAAAKASCQTAHAEILRENVHSVIYRIDLSQCANEKNQIAVGKAFNGDDAVYLVYYTAVTDKISKAAILQYSRVIETAKLIPYSATSARG